MQEKQKEVRIGVFYVLAAMLYLLVFSTATSPFYHHAYKQDASIFLLLGKSLAKGMIPYVEIFDHKGPVLFLLESPGWFLSEDGTWFVFWLQWLSLFTSLYFGHKLINLFVSGRKTVLYNLLSVVFVAATIERGNINEEFCLPWIVMSIYFVIGLLNKREQGSKRAMVMIFLGVAFAFVFLIRVNNAVPIAGLVLFLFLEDCAEKKWLELVKDGLCGLVGIGLIAIPVMVYLASVNALEAMWQASLFYNLGVVTSYSANSMVPKFLKAFPIIFLGIVSCVYMKRDKRTGGCLAIVSLVTLPALLVGSGYWHYFILIAWYVPLGLCLLHVMKIDNRAIRNLFLGFALICCVLYGRNVIMNIKYTADDILRAENTYIARNLALKELIASVPVEERKDIFTYNAEAEYYLETDTLPNYKYFTLQSSMSRVDASINEQWNEEFLKREPKWVVWNTGKACSNGQLMTWLEEDYELTGQYGTYWLFKKLEDN